MNVELIKCVPGCLLEEAKACFMPSYRSSPLDTWLILPNSASCKAVIELIAREDLPVITSQICTIPEFASKEFGKYSKGLQTDKSYEEIAGRRVLTENSSRFPLFSRGFRDLGSTVPELLAYSSTMDEFLVDPDLILGIGGGQKAKELCTFMKEYKRFLSNAGSVDQNSLLTIGSQIQKGKCPLMKHLVIAGFYEPKPIEKAFLTNLMKFADKVTIVHPFANAPSVFTENDIWKGVEGKKEIESPGLAGLFDNDDVKAEQGILVSDFKDPQEEARQVAQKIYQLLMDGTTASSICVLLPRRKEMYQVIESALDEFQIPYNIAVPLDLSGSQAVIAIFDLLQVVISNYDRETVIRLLKSPYLKFEIENEGKKERISGSKLDHLSREAGVINGRENWSRQLTTLAKTIRIDASSPDISPNRSRWMKVEADQAEQTVKLLEGLFDVLSKLQGQIAVRDRCKELRRILIEAGFSNHILCSERSVTYHDGKAVQQLLDSLESMERAEYLMGEINQTLEEFISQLRMVTSAGGFQGRPELEDAVMISGLRASYLVPYNHIFIVGMNDGDIPFLGAGNAFISESDVERLGLLNRKDLLRQEKFYFLSTLLCAKESIYLSRSLAIDDKPTVSSCFLEEVKRKLEPDAWGEKEISGSHLLAHRIAGEMLAGKKPLEMIQADLPLDVHEIARRKEIEDKCRTEEYDSPFDAVMEDKKVLEILQSKFTHDHIFSPSGLEKYARCPFSFYMEKVLYLEPLPEVALDLDARERGSLFHAIACQFYTQLRSKGETRVCVENLESYLSLISEIAEEKMASYSFSGARWDTFRINMLGRHGGRRGLLRAFVEHETASNSPLKPAMFELSFGRKPPEESDPTSSSTPIEIALGEGDPDTLKLAGMVDRVDLDDQNRFFIIDYKTGRSPKLSDIVQGTALQLPLYIEAVRMLIPDSKPLGGAYYQVRSESKLGLDTILAGKEDEALVRGIVGSKKLVPSLSEVIWNAKRSARSCVQGIRSGRFHPALNSRNCSDYCDYWTTCRFDQARMEDAEDEAEQ